jgi:hypothetical protein
MGTASSKGIRLVSDTEGWTSVNSQGTCIGAWNVNYKTQLGKADTGGMFMRIMKQFWQTICKWRNEGGDVAASIEAIVST